MIAVPFGVWSPKVTVVMGTRGGSGGSGVDAEGLGAAEGDVGVEGEVLAGNQAQGGIAAGEFGDGDPGFQLAQVGA